MRSLTLRGRDLVLKGRLTKWVTRIGERPRAPKDHKGLQETRVRLAQRGERCLRASWRMSWGSQRL